MPEAFPYRDLIVLTSFAVVLGTLVVQGLTLRPLLRVLPLRSDDPVSREVEEARRRALEAAYATLDDDSVEARIVRHTFDSRLNRSGEPGASHDHDAMHLRALEAARRVTFEMREKDDIGDDAFHRLEEEFDWIEMGIARRAGT